MKIHLKGGNSCNMRKQKLAHYAAYLRGNGHELTDDPMRSDAILYWTCAFRGDVLDNSVTALHGFHGSGKAQVYAVGCLPDIAPDALDGLGFTTIPWRDEKRLMENHFGAGGLDFEAARPLMVEDAVCADAALHRARHPEADVTFHDQFIKLLICEGCPFTCTYCSERLAFPPFRSFAPEELAERAVERVAATGHTRLILIADCLGEYGRDIGTTLPDLMKAIRARDSRITFALNNLHPANFLEYKADMEAFIRDGWIAHLNLPIQSGSDAVLTRMNRRYSVAQLRMLFDGLNRIGFRDFDTHVIVGFPGETDDDFRQTVSLLLDIGPRYVLLSRYLESPRAPSAGLPDKVGGAEAQRRMEEAGRRFIEAGIICNWEGSELVKDRLRRMNGANIEIGKEQGNG